MSSSFGVFAIYVNMSAIYETVNNILYEDQTDGIFQLSRIASKIALQNFEWRYTTLLFFTSTLWHGVELFLRSYEKAIVVGSGKFYPSFAHDTRQYVLFGTSINNIAHSLKWMRDHEFDNTGKHIIICEPHSESDCDETFAMREFWQHKITNVVFLKSTNNNVTGFTYFPLSDRKCNYHEPVELVNLDTCLEFNDPCDVFPMKLTNLHACPIIASTFVQPPYMTIKDGMPNGADGNLLSLLAEKLNGKLTVMTPRIGEGWGKAEKNDTWSGSLADLYYDYANLSMTSAALTLARFSFFQLSTAYSSSRVVWITHAAKKIPSSLKLAYPFQQNSQVAIIISYVLVTISAVIIQSRFWSRISRKIKMKRPRHGIVFYSWMICMGLPTTRLPKKTAYLHIVLLWIWYCVLIRTFYQASLITAMKSNYYYNEFDTIGEAIAAGYPFGGGSALKDFYIDDPTVYNQWTDVSTLDILPTLRELAQGMRFVLAMNMETAKNKIWEDKIHVHILKESIVVSPAVIFFKKFSPLVDSVNIVLVRLAESGFCHKFYKDYSSHLAVHMDENTLESIKLQHYTGCYAIIITGWLISGLLFVTEILFVRFYKQ